MNQNIIVTGIGGKGHSPCARQKTKGGGWWEGDRWRASQWHAPSDINHYFICLFVYMHRHTYNKFLVISLNFQILFNEKFGSSLSLPKGISNLF
jgi:hypothetical protein